MVDLAALKRELNAAGFRAALTGNELDVTAGMLRAVLRADGELTFVMRYAPADDEGWAALDAILAYVIESGES